MSDFLSRDDIGEHNTNNLEHIHDWSFDLDGVLICSVCKVTNDDYKKALFESQVDFE